MCKVVGSRRVLYGALWIVCRNLSFRLCDILTLPHTEVYSCQVYSSKNFLFYILDMKQNYRRTQKNLYGVI